MNYFLVIILAMLSFYLFYSQVAKAKIQKSNYIFQFFVLYKIIILTSISMIVVFINKDVNFVLRNSNFDKIYLPLIYTVFYLSVFILVCRIFDILENRNNKHNIVFETKHFSNILVAWTLLAVMVFCFNLLTLGVPQIKLFAGLTNRELAFIRVSEIHNAGSSLFKNILGRDLSIFLAFLSISYWITSKKHLRRRYSVLLIINVFLLTYYSTLQLSKSGLVNAILYCLLYYYSLRAIVEGKFISKLQVLIIIILAFLSVILLFYLVFPEWSALQLLGYLSQRIFVSQISGFVYTTTTDFRSEDGILSLISYFAEVLRVYDFIAPGQIITKTLFTEEFNAGRMNYISTFFLSDAYWLMGGAGVIFASVHVALLLRFACYLFYFGYPRPVMTALMGFFFFGSNFNSSYFPFTISTSTVFICFVLLFTVKRVGFWIAVRDV